MLGSDLSVAVEPPRVRHRFAQDQSQTGRERKSVLRSPRLKTREHRGRLPGTPRAGCATRGRAVPADAPARRRTPPRAPPPGSPTRRPARPADRAVRPRSSPVVAPAGRPSSRRVPRCGVNDSEHLAPHLLNFRRRSPHDEPLCLASLRFPRGRSSLSVRNRRPPPTARQANSPPPQPHSQGLHRVQPVVPFRLACWIDRLVPALRSRSFRPLTTPRSQPPFSISTSRTSTARTSTSPSTRARSS